MIQLQNIRKTYVKDNALKVLGLDDISLSIKPGEFVGIMGPSGSGKSTLINILGLLDRPDSGTYIFDKLVVNELNNDESASLRNEKIGFVFQSFHLLPQTTAQENVEVPLMYSKKNIPFQASIEALKVVGLEKRLTHYPSELSGGEQQRVAIARSLINEPDIILADEPTGNLDTQSGLEVMGIFQRLNQMGKTVVLITHDLFIAEHCDRILEMKDGKIIKEIHVEHPRLAKQELKEKKVFN